jgi:hydrogenase maturation protease
MKILVLGMGSPILSDDGVGLVLAERLRKRLKGVEVAANPMVGLGLLEQIIGYDKIFIIDATTSAGGKIGEMKIISETDGQGSLHLFSSHGLNIFDLLELGRRCDCPVPDLTAVYGIEIGNEVAFGTGLTPTLGSRIDDLEEAILRDIQNREPLLVPETSIIPVMP